MKICNCLVIYFLFLFYNNINRVLITYILVII